MDQAKLNKDFFNYTLPEELIAQNPCKKRSSSRLLHIDCNKKLHDLNFRNIENLLNEGDLLIFNDTKVIKARIITHKESGGKIEIMIERLLNDFKVLAQLKSSKNIKKGTKLFINKEIYATVEHSDNYFFELTFSRNINQIMEQYGSIPLPPYIRKTASEIDELRYQTVYAKNYGAVAAPTAGLHFDAEILNRLGNLGIKTSFLTLHVGAGTFKPIRNNDIDEHIMHSERYYIPKDTIEAMAIARRYKKRIIAVGTTSARALESASLIQNNYDEHNRVISKELTCETKLYIKPGYKFRIIDALITNFHLPQSTLLLLVAALAGQDTIYNAYQHAIKKEYRFFSYGDAMFIE